MLLGLVAFERAVVEVVVAILFECHILLFACQLLLIVLIVLRLLQEVLEGRIKDEDLIGCS